MDIIRGLTAAQFLFVILLFALWDFGLARLIYLLLLKSRITGRGVLTWITGAVLLTAFRALSFEYVQYRVRTHTVTEALGWLYLAALPEASFCDLTAACQRVFRSYSEQSFRFWVVYVMALMFFNMIILLPVTQIRMKRKRVQQAS